MTTRSKRGSSEPLASLPGEGDDALTPEQLIAKYGAPARVKSLSELHKEAKGDAPPAKKQKLTENFFSAPTPNGHVATLVPGENVIECSFGAAYEEAKSLIPEDITKNSTVVDEYLNYTGTLDDAKRLFLAAGFDVLIDDAQEGEGDEGDGDVDAEDEEDDDGLEGGEEGDDAGEED